MMLKLFPDTHHMLPLNLLGSIQTDFMPSYRKVRAAVSFDPCDPAMFVPSITHPVG
jgi:hypothetical protein